MHRIAAKLTDLFRNRAELMRQSRWLGRVARPFLPQLLALFALQSVGAVLSVGLTLINRTIIDRAIEASGAFDTRAFALLVGLTVLSIVIGAGSGVVVTMITERSVFALRTQLFRHVLHSRWEALKRYHSGDIQTRLTGDLGTVASGICSLVPETMGLILRLALAFAVLFNFDWMLAVAALLLGPVGLFCGLLFTGKMHKYQVQSRENDAGIRSFMQESTENVTVLKAFSMEEAAAGRFEQMRGERMEIVRRQSTVSALSRLTMNLVYTLGRMLAFGWGILRVSRTEITYGTMSVFLSLMSQIQGPIMGMGSIVPQFISMLASAGRVMELEEMAAEAPAEPAGMNGQVGIRLDKVCFAYADKTDDQEPVLTDVCMEVRPGESAALVGATGSGKTTIARLLLDLIEPQKGSIVFYDRDGRELQASPSTRGLIAYVPQGNTLSSGTIRQNLVTGDVTDEELRQALITAEAGFALELGLDTRIGERGLGLSEGQAQRLAIARALLRKAPVLILDEASASLDMETERRIMENLRAASTGMTCVVITHRPSLLAICDRCYHVENGFVTEQAPGEYPTDWI